MIVVDVLLAAMLLTGCLLGLIAAFGLHRFPDVFCRMHAATKPLTLGSLLILAATGARLTETGDVVKVVLVIALIFLTIPAGAHMIGRAAYRSNRVDRTRLKPDELEGRGPY